MIWNSIAKTESIVLYKDKYYFVPIDSNYLYRMDYDLTTVEPVARIDEKDSVALYSHIVCWGNKLILVPKLAEKIAIYDVDTCEIKYISFRKDIYTHDNVSAFLYYVVINCILYLIPWSHHAIIKIDLNLLNVKEIELNTSGLICDGVGALIGDNIWFPVKSEHNVMVLNTKTDEVSYLFSKSMDVNYSYIMNCGEFALLVPADKKIPLLKYYYVDSKTEYVYSDTMIDNFKAVIIEKNLYLLTKQLGRIIQIDTCGDVKELLFNEYLFCPNTAEQWECNIRQIHVFKRKGRLCLINGYTAEWFLYDNGWKPVKLAEEIRGINCLKLDYGILPLI